MRRVMSYAVMVVVLVAAAGAAVISSRSSSPAASAASVTTTTVPSVTGFYLDMGASASLGYQPTGITNHNGRRTDTGYANDLLFLERLRGVALTLDQVGCPGDVVQTVLNIRASDACYTAPQTQLTKAVQFLQANQSAVGVVTVDFGFNSVRLCLTPHVPNEACVATGIAAVTVDLPKILAQVKAAAGPHVHIVGLELGDPFLADFLDGPEGPSEANETLVAMNDLNAALVAAYHAAGVAVANVPAFWQLEDSTEVDLPNVGEVPENVKEACQLTWMCYGSPFGPDDHPNDAGYSFIAQAIFAALPKL